MATPSTTGAGLPVMSTLAPSGPVTGKPPSGLPLLPGMAPGGSALAYTPSVVMASIGAIAFTSLALWLLFQMRKHKSSYFFISLQGLFFLAAGLWARVAMAIDSKNKVAPIVMSVTSLIGPPFLFIGVSMTFTRVMWWITPTASRNMKTLWFPPRSATMIFGGLALIIDNAKGFVSAPHSSLPLVFGLLEIFICTMFVLLTFRYYLVSSRWRSEENVGRGWWMLVLACIVAAILYIIHLIYQIALASAKDQDPKSFIATTESFFWIFDMIPLLSMFILFAFIQPGAIIPRVWTRSAFDSELILELLKLRKAAGSLDAEVELQTIAVKPDKF